MKRLNVLLVLLLVLSMLTAPLAHAAPGNVAYKVEHYLATADGANHILADTDTLSGTANTYTEAEARVYEGFTAQPFSQVLIDPEGTTVVRIRYERNSYVLAWSTDGDPLTGNYSSGSMTYGAAIRLPNTPTKQGYTFAGWSSAVAPTMPAAYTVYTAQWTPNDNTPYTVSHFCKNLEGGGYTLIDTERRTGVTAAYTSVVARTITGFSSLPFQQAVIAPDGSTAVSIYYDRNRYTLVWEPNGGTLKGNYSDGSLLYGTPLTVPAIERNGYDFAGWSSAVAPTMPAAFTTYSAHWTARPYVIRYELNGGTLPDGLSNPESYGSDSPTFTLHNPTRSGYTFVGWNGTGLTEPTMTVTIPAGSKLDMTFTAVWRAETWPVTLHTNGGTINSGNVAVYTSGIGATLPTDVTRDGYVFAGWRASSGLTGSVVTGIGTTESGAKEFWAKWVERIGSSYQVRHFKQAANGSGYVLAETETLSGTAGKQTEAAAKHYQGFTARSFSQAAISENGDTVIDIYYDRNFFTLSWDPVGGALSGSYTQGPTRYGSQIVTPLVSRDGYIFDGWFEDPEYTIPWNGGSEPDGSELTLHARWIQTDDLHRVQVKVFLGSEDGMVVTDAEVRLMRGGMPYRSLACSGGVYSASDVANGDYTIAVTSADGLKSSTKALRVDGADPSLVKIILPFGSLSAVIELGSGVPAITVTGLDDIAADESIMGPQALGQETTLKLSIGSKQDYTGVPLLSLSPEEQADKAAAGRIRSLALSDLGDQVNLKYYEVLLIKIMTDSYGNTNTEQIIDTGDHVLTFTIPYQAQDDEMKVYRDHVDENGDASTTALTREADPYGAHEDGTYYQDAQSIVMFNSRFSIIGFATLTNDTDPNAGNNGSGGPGGPGGNGDNGGGTGDNGGGAGDTNGGTSGTGGTGGPGGTGGTGDNGGGTGGGTTYIIGQPLAPINVIPSDGGKIQPSAGSAYPGESVTLESLPDTGYVLNSLTVQDKNGGSVPLSVLSDGVFSFVMPTGGVTVTSSFLSSEERFRNTGVSNRLDTDDHIVFIRGFTDGLVKPNGNITRAEVAMIFYRLLRDNDVTTSVTFTDVPEDAWYAEAVHTLAALGIVNGVGHGRFEPNRSITRAEFTTFACRFANMIPSDLTFLDVRPDHWAAKYIACAASYGWINGYGDGNFGPEDPLTRAQGVAIVNRMMNRIPDKDYIRTHLDSLVYFPDLTDESRWYYFDIYEAANAHTFTVENGTEHWNP